MTADTEYTGPAALYLHADIEGGPDAHWIVVINDIAPDGRKTLVSKGWLKASHRELDAERSRPERPYHPHTRKLEVKPGEIYDYAIELRDSSYVFKKGHRMQLLIRGQSSPWEDFTIFFHLNHMDRVRHRIHHTSRHASHLVMPLIETAEQEEEICAPG
jgi:predicted acyl esterase